MLFRSYTDKTTIIVVSPTNPHPRIDSPSSTSPTGAKFFVAWANLEMEDNSRGSCTYAVPGGIFDEPPPSVSPFSVTSRTYLYPLSKRSAIQPITRATSHPIYPVCYCDVASGDPRSLIHAQLQASSRRERILRSLIKHWASYLPSAIGVTCGALSVEAGE